MKAKDIISITLVYFLSIFLIKAQQASDSKQNPNIDKTLHELAMTGNDTIRVLLMGNLCNWYKFEKPDSSLFYGNKALVLSRKINLVKKEPDIMHNMVLAHNGIGNYSGALQIIFQALKICEDNNLMRQKAILLTDLARYYSLFKNYEKALSIYKETKVIFDYENDSQFYTRTIKNIGETYLLMNQSDSALYYLQAANNEAVQMEGRTSLKYNVLLALGEFQIKFGDTDLALNYFWEVLSQAINADQIFKANFSIAKLYQQIANPDSSIFYGKKSLLVAQESGIYSNIIEAGFLLSGIYEKNDPKQALEYNNLGITWQDSLRSIAIATTLESFIDFDEQERKYEIETATATYRNRIQRMWIFSIAGALLSTLFVAFILFRNNKNKQKANAQLKEQKEKIEHQKNNVEQTLSELKSTQSQLIQSEKMASLGELTAGIAHEIQNPLNFVNNFSEVNTELIEEIEQEIDIGNFDDLKSITKDLKENESKINHHGKRAEAIVKGMLQHSRTNSGEKMPIDINALADEYLRLSYHGLRAKDKSFNADFKLEADNTLPKINVIPQDIGRVLLNLINNAFYAVDKKAKEIDPLIPKGGKREKEFKPLVTVGTTSYIPPSGGARGVKITVTDNGPGIPSSIKDKIFQPFFTTKPTGSGTGLGLSLSYDIVKAHGGEITVENVNGNGTEFIITIPIQS